ncbi:DUF6789 family protein [Brevundimonas sp. SORGH_AS_0993]|uniref:DUF6789 family protein n=1 Tax=Brevundimonas sp. SORGH_AS_0993 TaxID=3041794 RepID=UPI0027893188|nr:DUF6789 family protein [Brevundimonas sp. SORGH_AS_0993]MDQ1152864.1 low affinity Fe/Cu permease [Brevundimonas sp. SORGH_AS_0993]
MMSRLQKGLIAGAAATLAASLLEIPNLFLNWFDPFQGVIASMIGMPGNLAVGWAMHVVIGVFALGPLFGLLCPRLPTDTPETKGIVFAVGAWVLMMVGVMMFGNYRTFTAGAGFGTIAWLLITHAVFGIVMGNVYARLVAREKRGAVYINGAPAH